MIAKNTTSKKEKKCYFCVNGLNDIDFKDATLLRKFLSGYAKILPSKRTRVCSKHQRKLSTAIKRARFLAILPFVNR